MYNTKYSKKKVALSAALVVAVLALAGIGYAHVYNGTTPSASQTVDVDYVAIEIDSGSAYGYTDAKNVHTTYDSESLWVTDDVVTTYTYNSAQSDEVVVYTLKVLRPADAYTSETDSFTVKASITTGSAPAGYTVNYYLGTVAVDGETTFAYALDSTVNISPTAGTPLPVYFAVKLVPTATSVTDAPATSATIPGFTFTVTGTQTH